MPTVLPSSWHCKLARACRRTAYGLWGREALRSRTSWSSCPAASSASDTRTPSASSGEEQQSSWPRVLRFMVNVYADLSVEGSAALVVFHTPLRFAEVGWCFSDPKPISVGRVAGYTSVYWSSYKRMHWNSTGLVGIARSKFVTFVSMTDLYDRRLQMSSPHLGW